jgi:curli biogenesis system outer membrane secretion channel CsgG
LLKAIVDRDEMTNLIKELKLESIAGSNEGAASKIARILGADMIITGLVSPIETDNKYVQQVGKNKAARHASNKCKNGCRGRFRFNSLQDRRAE